MTRITGSRISTAIAAIYEKSVNPAPFAMVCLK